MRSRVIPGSSPTIDRRLAVNRLNSVLLPTLGRPTIATSGSFAAPVFTGTTDLRYVGKGTPAAKQSKTRRLFSVLSGSCRPPATAREPSKIGALRQRKL